MICARPDKKRKYVKAAAVGSNVYITTIMLRTILSGGIRKGFSIKFRFFFYHSERDELIRRLVRAVSPALSLSFIITL